MEIWILLNKLVLVIYFIVLYVQENQLGLKNITMVVSLLLTYILLNLIKAILPDIKIKRILIFASLLICIFTCLFISTKFMIFIPLTIIEINQNKVPTSFLILSLLAFSMIFVKKDMLDKLIISSFSSLLLYEILTRSQQKINRITNINDSLLKKNKELSLNAENYKEYENQIVYTSKLEERNKIAQEIHDKLGHTISANIMQLEAAKLIYDVEPEKSKNMIQSSVDELRLGMENIRSTLRSIKPPKEQMGINRVKLILDKFSKDSGIAGKLYYEGNIDSITFLQWKLLCDNINEALTNTMKYSGAQNLYIKIQVLNKVIKTEVKDDGKGCIKYLKGLGLTGIEERTENLGGKLIVDGSDGFSVIILLPII